MSKPIVVEMPLEEVDENTHAVKPYGYFLYLWHKIGRFVFRLDKDRFEETLRQSWAAKVASLESELRLSKIELIKAQQSEQAAKVELDIQGDMLARIQSRIKYETNQYKANGGG